MVRNHTVSGVRHSVGMVLMGLAFWLMTGMAAYGQEETIEKGKGLYQTIV